MQAQLDPLPRKKVEHTWGIKLGSYCDHTLLVCLLNLLRLSLSALNFQVQIDPLPGKKVEHMGIKIELLGQIEL